MRRDIEINIGTKDIVLKPMESPVFSDFRWLDGVPEGELQEYLYGEITVPSYKPERVILSDGLNVKIGYKPIYYPMKMRVRQINDDGESVYATNPTNGSIWFNVKTQFYGGDRADVMASELPLIHEDSYHLVFERQSMKVAGSETLVPTGNIIIFSAYVSDFSIARADSQNTSLLIECIPGNNYRYPLTGVGAVRWINGNMNQSEVAETLQSEFANDGVTIRSASYDDDEQKLYIDANYDNLD